MKVPKFEFMNPEEATPMLVIMGSNTHPAERARAMERMLDQMMIAGQLDRLNQTQRCQMRGIVFGLAVLADDLAEPKTSKSGWWRIWR